MKYFIIKYKEYTNEIMILVHGESEDSFLFSYFEL